MFTFVRVVVEPGVRTTAVAWEAPAKRSPAFYLLLADDKIVGGVAKAGIAAADCRYLVLQHQHPDAAAAAAPAVGIAAEGGSGPPVGTEAIAAGRSCGKIVPVVGACDS